MKLHRACRKVYLPTYTTLIVYAPAQWRTAYSLAAASDHSLKTPWNWFTGCLKRCLKSLHEPRIFPKKKRQAFLASSYASIFLRFFVLCSFSQRLWWLIWAKIIWYNKRYGNSENLEPFVLYEWLMKGLSWSPSLSLLSWNATVASFHSVAAIYKATKVRLRT